MLMRNILIRYAYSLRKNYKQGVNKKDQHTTNNDFQDSYKKLDLFIEQYNVKGDQISPSILNQILYINNPKLYRNSNYLLKLTSIFKQCTHHFKQNAEFYSSNKRRLPLTLYLYQILNIHRSQIFQIAEQTVQFVPDRQGKNIQVYIKMYQAMVELHHSAGGKSLFKTKLKKYILEGLYISSKDKRQITERDLKTLFTFLKYIIMDKSFEQQIINNYISFLQTNIISKIKKLSFLDHYLSYLIAYICQLTKLFKIQIKSKNFRTILQTALKYKISQKSQFEKKVIHQKYFQVYEDENRQLKETKETRIITNKNKTVFGISSIFQTIFSKQLQKNGYVYEKNVLIGMFQYDLIVYGRKNKDYFPFCDQDMNKNLLDGNCTKNNPPISKQQWQTFKTTKLFQKIQCNQQFSNPIILNLNGPSHYINSDVYGTEKVSRTQQLKYEFIKNYGYKHLNVIHHKQWQQIDQNSILVKQFIQNSFKTNIIQK